MDFRQSTQPNSRPNATPPAAGTPTSSVNSPKKGINERISNAGIFRILNLAILVGVAVLIAGIALAFVHGNNNNENKYVDSAKYQAVFLNNGQVYFGHIANINSNYVNLTGIYYLTQSTSGTTSTPASSGNYTLIKLGCQQIHDPFDQMLINRTQVTFWENINDSGQVAQKVAQFKKTYPNGPDCSQVSAQTQAPSTSTQGAITTPTATKP